MFVLNNLKRLGTSSVQISTWLLAIIAIAAIGCGSRAAQKKAQEEKYDFEFQKVTAEIAQLTNEEARMERATVFSISGADVVETAAGESEKMVELKKEQSRILDKLISLYPEKDRYRFELAKIASARGDRAEAMTILNELAPENMPGYGPAHLILAKQLIELPVTTKIQQYSNLDIALKHINHLLRLDQNDQQAKLLKAGILGRQERYEGAYELYEQLFDSNPNYYREMLKLNKLMGREDRDQPLCEKALATFQLLSENEKNRSDDKRWVVMETGIANTLQILGRFEDAETRVEEQIERYTSDPKGGARRVFLQRLNADNYLVWARTVAGGTPFDSLPPASLEKLLELSTKAYRIQGDNVMAMQTLARLSLFSNNEMAAKARAVYDPEADIDAPAPVLNQLGNHALLNKRYSEAIRYYERAREKSPRDPAVLNNLAYSYLVSEDESNPQRALQLINDAISKLPKKIDPVEMANFLHTKATALKKMDRLQEALAVYERSLRSRPMHLDTLQSLIECYRGLNFEPPEQYVERIVQIKEEKRQAEGATSGQ